MSATADVRHDSATAEDRPWCGLIAVKVLNKNTLRKYMIGGGGGDEDGEGEVSK